MDLWKYFDVSHRDHVICNPLSVEKLDELVSVVDLNADAKVLDIACGKAELLIRLAERYAIAGDGVDLSPYAVRDARSRAAARNVADRLTFHEQDGRLFDFSPGEYDLAMCIGASWTFDGHSKTLSALQSAVRSGGLVVVGEPFWRKSPAAEYLAASEQMLGSFGSLESNVTDGLALGLTFLYCIVSSDDDWDRYAGLQWRAAERYAVEHADDPDAVEILRRQRKNREQYFRWQRDTLGWAVYVFRTEPP